MSDLDSTGVRTEPVKEIEPLDIKRSHDMEYLEITIPNEILNTTIRQLGDSGRLHVVDLSHQSSGDVSKYLFAYKKRATDLGDLTKKLNSFTEQCKFREIPLEIPDYSQPLGLFGEQLTARNPDLLVGAQEFILEVESRLLNNIAFERNVQSEIARRAELSVTLEAASRLVPQSIAKVQENVNNNNNQTVLDQFMTNSNISRDDDIESADGPLTSFICGVIPIENIPILSRIVYRTSKGGNAVIRFESIEQEIIDPATGVGVKKAVFCVSTIGRQLYRRITKLCPTVGATIYPITTFDTSFVQAERSRLASEIDEQNITLARTTSEIRDILTSLATPQMIDGEFGPSILNAWQQLLFIEKVMIDVLMKCSFHATFVRLGAWIPTEFKDDIFKTVEKCSEIDNNGAKPMIDSIIKPSKVNSTPPTYIPMDTFTAPFQILINTYGIPAYKEFNPALIAIGTFPFIFGVMFGDIGHGLLLLLIAIFLVSKEAMFEQQKKNKTMNEMVAMVYSSRYFLIMLSCLAIYCGFIYNDFMANPLNFSSSNSFDPETGLWTGYVYPFGLSPNWFHKSESLKFFNSFKMKMAVILGVTHMLFSSFLSLFNYIYFKNHVAIFFEFIPRVLFLLVTFGWMITMIIIKWCIDWAQPDRGIGNAPSIIQTMINMFLSPGGDIPPAQQLIPGQSGFQLVLVLIAAFLIPFMWFVQPVIEYKKSKGEFLPFIHSPIDDERIQRQTERVTRDQLNDLDAPHDDHVHNDDDDHSHGHTFGDVIVHHSIHTIEYILGTVSNTASYLRLWALSLAHAQLSETFWNMFADYGYNSSIPGQSAAGVAILVCATFAVIICMDSLECVLHTLRLHWVESMSRHFKGAGVLYQPFNFEEKAE